MHWYGPLGSTVAPGAEAAVAAVRAAGFAVGDVAPEFGTGNKIRPDGEYIGYTIGSPA